MGNWCCCPGPPSGPDAGSLKFLDPANNKSNNTGVATSSRPAPERPAEPSGPQPEPAARTSLGERLMFYPRREPGRRSAAGRSDHCESRAAALFERYRDPAEDAVLAEGILLFCQDLGVRPEEFKVLLLAWKFGAEQMCRFTREEFLAGCRALRTDSIASMRAKFPDLLAEARDPSRFRDLYRFTFKFGLEAGQRVLPTETAVQLWRLVFSEDPPPVLDRWLAFLGSHPQVRGITGDTWNMFLHFAETAGRDLSTYDDSEAWPSLYDDFVEYENDQTNQNVLPQGKNGAGGDVGVE